MGRASAHKNRAGPLERNTPDRSRPINACWQIVALRRMEIACVRLLSRLLGFFAAQVLILIALCFPHRCARFAGAEPASRAEGTCADVHLSDVEGRCLTRQAAVHMLDPYRGVYITNSWQFSRTCPVLDHPYGWTVVDTTSMYSNETTLNTQDRDETLNPKP